MVKCGMIPLDDLKRRHHREILVRENRLDFVLEKCHEVVEKPTKDFGAFESREQQTAGHDLIRVVEQGDWVSRPSEWVSDGRAIKEENIAERLQIMDFFFGHRQHCCSNGRPIGFDRFQFKSGAALLSDVSDQCVRLGLIGMRSLG
jgi:hypothetical protein